MATALTEGGETQEAQHAVEDAWGLEQAAPPKKGSFAGISDCILLFGAFCNGNMGDVVQALSMEHLLSSVAPPEQCFYYAHHRGESPSKGFRIGEFFGGDKSKLIKISTPTAWKVNRFKALVIGGGGIFAAEHAPLFQDAFAEAVNVPIVVVGVGANYLAKEYGTLLQKAVFVSGRDTPSIERFAGILGGASTPAVRPDGVRLVRDPVLSDQAFTDTDGTCWRQSSGDQEQPLCFVLPAATSLDTVEMHKQLRASVVRRGDRFINVFPKHREELAQFEYPGTVEEIPDPMEYVQQLCSCKAIISTRFHGAILGLHMGVPTFGAFRHESENKVPDLMIDTMDLPDQFFLVDASLNREVVDGQVDTIRRLYEDGGRRGAIHDKLSVFHKEFQAEARRMFDVVGTALRHPEQQTPAPPQSPLSPGEEVRQAQHDEGDAARGEAEVQGSPATEVAAEAAAAGAAAVAVADATALPTMPPSPDSLPTPVKGGGNDATVAVFLLFAIAGLALLPSTVGRRGRGSFQARSGEASASLKASPSLFALNFVLWIALAVAFSSYSKSYLRDTHDPVGLLALQGLTGSVILFVLGRLGLGASDSPSPSDASRKIHGLRRLQAELTTASPRETLVAVLHSGQAFLTNFSLFVGGVAVTNALKAMEPVAAAVFSYFLLGKRVAPVGVAALAITVAGIVLLTSKARGGGSTKDDGGDTDTGEGDHHSGSRVLVSAAFTMAAVSCNALRNVVIKKGDPIPPHRTLFTCSVAAGMIGVTLILVRGMIRSMDDLLLGGENGVLDAAAQYGSWLSMDGVNAAICFVGYNFASFNLLACLSPVGHAVGNSVKRVVMFGSGIVLMGEVMNVRQLAGAAVALFGVGVYNVAGRRK